jgi:fermentation-respiration switch protein FrsA (DUF1100 family)
MNLLRIILFLVVGVYAAMALYMFLQQRSLQYHPTHKRLTPSGEGLAGVTEEIIATPDGEKLIAWYAEAAPGTPTILFFHGNGGEVGDRAGRLNYYKSRGFGALFVSYRGYGGSSGAISENGFIIDALAAYDWLMSRNVRPKQIYVIGESLGTGIAVQLAAQRKIAALALEAPFTSAADVAAEIYWWLPVRLLMKDTFHSRDFIGKVTVPVLIQHGDSDGVIPVGHSRKLFAMANEPKDLVILTNGGHEAIYDPEVWKRELAFFRKHSTSGATTQ